MNKDIKNTSPNVPFVAEKKQKFRFTPLQMTEIPVCPFNKIAIDLVTKYETSSSATNTFLP